MNVVEKNVENNASELKVITSDAFARQENSDEMEIDLVDLGMMLLERVHYIVLFLLLGALLMNAYAYFFIKPTYVSTARMYVVSASDDSMVDLTDLNIGTSLTADYEQLIMSYPVLDQVAERMGGSIGSANISISNPSGTRILNVTVSSDDPELSRDVANTVVAVAIEYLPKTMGTEEPNIAQEARAATGKSGPNLSRYTMMGALLGALLFCGYLIVRYMMDDTVRTAEDIEKYFGVVPLTSIPDIAIVNENHEKRIKQQQKKKR